jgi:methyltransferase (TIGR00027 family)
MKRNRASLTAEGIAIARVLESEKPEGERICYDPYARQLISPAFYWIGKLFADREERKGPGVIGFLVARCRFIDDVLQDFLKNGLQQLVILGAGLDSRAFRFEGLKHGVKLFEVDHPATQAVKIEKVKALFGELPGHLIYVPIDFNEEKLEKLLKHGYNRKLKTLFIWEGVSMYLTPAAVDQTLTWMSSHSAKGSRVVFDFLYASALNGKKQPYEIRKSMRAGKLTGEGITFGIEQGGLKKFMAQRGFSNVKEIASVNLHEMYFHGVNENRVVGDVYAIAVATIEKTKYS